MPQAMADCILEGAFRRGWDRDRDLGDAFQYSRRLTRPYGREG